MTVRHRWLVITMMLVITIMINIVIMLTTNDSDNDENVDITDNGKLYLR